MSQPNSRTQLIKLLHDYGLSTYESAPETQGFPLELNLSNGSNVVIELPNPALVSSLDPDEIGVAIIDPLGYPRNTWGLAKRVPYFKGDKSLLSTPVAGLMEGGAYAGHGALYLEGVRYFSTGPISSTSNDIFVLVVNAHDEKRARGQASKGWRVANTLKRLGKALTMHQTVSQITVAAAHEVASCADLAAVLLWTCEPDSETLELNASVGVNRAGTQALNVLNAKGGSGSLAELVADQREPFFVNNVLHHLMSAQLEAKSCYLKAGGLSLHPLVISDRLLGVLELVGKENDTEFAENQEMFQTIAEHLALALNSAQMYEHAEKWASHDALTGISNHRSLQEFLSARLNEADRGMKPLSVVMIDVDHFRSFNEEEGHDAGDEVLRKVAEALKVTVRPYDMAARYGGEEFTLVLPGATMKDALTLSERVREKVEGLSYFNKVGHQRHITISLGVATFPVSGMDAASLLKAADGALYQAKRDGRNRVVAYDGQNEDKNSRSGIDLEKVVKRLRLQDRIEGERLLAELSPTIVFVAEALNLTITQTLVLRALVLVVRGYQNAFREGGLEALHSLDAEPDFRLLLPGLHGLEERCDGGGPQGLSGAKIPLLARILAVLLATVENDGKAFKDDPNRFDSNLVSLLREKRDAA